MEERDNSSRRSAVFGQFRFDLATRELRKHGTKIRLEEKAGRLLCVLIDSSGTIVSRQELHEVLWPNGVHVDFNHGLNNCINKLRLLLGDDSSKPRFIETLSRRGYRFIAPIEILDDAIPAGALPAILPLASLTGREGSEVSVSLIEPVALAPPADASWWGKGKFGLGSAVTLGLLIVILLTTARFSFLARTKTHAALSRTDTVRSVGILHNGAVDPLDEGFKTYTFGKFESDVVRNSANSGFDRLKVVSNDQGYYSRKLSDAEKRFAKGKDWKLTCVCALEKGGAFADIDFGKDQGAPRFDITFLQEGSKYFVGLTKQISPGLEWERKIEFPGVADVDHPHTFELRYNHVPHSADLWIDGLLMASDYHGHSQFRGDRGLMFGSFSYLNAQVGIAVFRTVRFEAY